MSLEELIEVPKTIDILLALSEKPLHIKELREKVGGSFQTVYKALNWLKYLGLVEKERKGRYVKVRLTNKGSAIASKLSLISSH